MPINLEPEDHAVFARLKSNGNITHSLRRLIVQRWNRCTSCDHSIADGRPAFAGYNSNHEPHFTCANCATLLIELATPIYWSDTLNLSAPDSAQIWRYMDLAKFIALLQQRGLFLPRADKLDDPFEAAAGLSNRQKIWDEHYLSYFREAMVSLPTDITASRPSAEDIEVDAQRLLQSLKQIGLNARQQLVSCWHKNDSESEALWRIYTPPPVPGVAIRSTIGRLWDASASRPDAIVGRVHYVDFTRSFASLQSERIFQKRWSLSHENEIRLVLANDREALAEAHVLQCDLDSLIAEVVVSPFAPNWLINVVSEVVERFGFAIPVRQSELLDQPFF